MGGHTGKMARVGVTTHKLLRKKTPSGMGTGAPTRGEWWLKAMLTLRL